MLSISLHTPISQCTRLHTLRLVGTFVTSTIVSSFPPSLTTLSFQNSGLTTDSLHHLYKLTNLKTLNLAGVGLEGEQIRDLPEWLEILDISSNHLLAPMDLSLLPPHLTYIKIKSCAKLSKSALQAIPVHYLSTTLGERTRLPKIKFAPCDDSEPAARAWRRHFRTSMF